MIKVAFETDINVDELIKIIDNSFVNENNRDLFKKGIFRRNSKNRIVLNYYTYGSFTKIFINRTKLINTFVGTYKKINNKILIYGSIYNFKNDIFSIILYCIMSFSLMLILSKIVNNIFIPLDSMNESGFKLFIGYLFSCVIPILVTSIFVYYKYYIYPFKHNKAFIKYISDILKCKVVKID
jgi:hypothetical protein